MSFLTRWSRLKHKAASEKPNPPAKTAEAAPAELPPVDSLTFESDFAAFLKANVEESVKRAALKKLLHDPRFNVMDGLDTYIDDYTQDPGIPEEMLKTLEHARSTLFPPQEKVAEAPQEEPQEEPAKADENPKTSPDGDTRQDA
jgi:hypothetical protein